MATPQFGGSNNVDELDIGQSGSVRATAGTARWSGNVLEGADEPTDVRHGLAQQNVVFRDVLGFAGKRVRWTGTLKVDNATTLEAIVSDLNQRVHGSPTTGGVIGAPDPSKVRETRLTDSFGRIITERAVLQDWQMADRIKTVVGQAPLSLLVSLEVVFFVL